MKRNGKGWLTGLSEANFASLRGKLLRQYEADLRANAAFAKRRKRINEWAWDTLGPPAPIPKDAWRGTAIGRLHGG